MADCDSSGCPKSIEKIRIGKHRVMRERNDERSSRLDRKRPRLPDTPGCLRRRQKEKLSADWDSWDGMPSAPGPSRSPGKARTQTSESKVLKDPVLTDMLDKSARLSKRITKLRSQGDVLLQRRKLMCEKENTNSLQIKNGKLWKKAMNRYWRAYLLSLKKLRIQNKVDEIYRRQERYDEYELDEDMLSYDMDM